MTMTTRHQCINPLRSATLYGREFLIRASSFKLQARAIVNPGRMVECAPEWGWTLQFGQTRGWSYILATRLHRSQMYREAHGTDVVNVVGK